MANTNPKLRKNDPIRISIKFSLKLDQKIKNLRGSRNLSLTLIKNHLKKNLLSIIDFLNIFNQKVKNTVFINQILI